MYEGLFHDNGLIALRFVRLPERVQCELEMLDHSTQKSVLAVFPGVDWISADLVGVLAHEAQVDHVMELPIDEAPPLATANKHCTKLYEIALCGGSTCRVVSLPMEVT